jgi:hypothetical protein
LKFQPRRWNQHQQFKEGCKNLAHRHFDGTFEIVQISFQLLLKSRSRGDEYGQDTWGKLEFEALPPEATTLLLKTGTTPYY